MENETKFDRSKFNYFGGYLTYNIGTEAKPDEKFIARFRYRGGGKASFLSFLIKNFTVEEYLTRAAGKEAPLEILNAKGYISPNVRKVLKSYGLPANQTGLEGLRERNRREAQA